MDLSIDDVIPNVRYLGGVLEDMLNTKRAYLIIPIGHVIAGLSQVLEILRFLPI
jgi:hypothetical protein